MTTRRKIVGGMMAAAALPGLARAQDAPQDAAQAAAQYIPVPFTMTADGTIVIDVRINGGAVYPFALDTGSSASGMLYPLAARLGLKPLRTKKVNGVGSTGVTGVFLADEAQFGPYLHQKGVAFTGIRSLGGGYSGLLAAGFLTTAPSILDYGAKEIRVYVRGEPDLSDFITVKSFFLQPDADGSEMIGVNVTIDGISMRLLVDSGADAHVLLFPSTVRGHDLWDKYGEGAKADLFAVTGAASHDRVVTMPDFALSDVTVPHLPVTLMDPAGHNENSGVDGLLGSRFLRLFAMGVVPKRVAFRPIAQTVPAAAAASSSS